MYYTYVLFCENKNVGKSVFYVGRTKNIEQRENTHFWKSVKTTKKFKKITLIYYEACLNKKDAIIRERQLKTGFGRGYLKRRLKHYLAQRD